MNNNYKYKIIDDFITNLRALQKMFSPGKESEDFFEEPAYAESLYDKIENKVEEKYKVYRTPGSPNSIFVEVIEDDGKKIYNMDFSNKNEININIDTDTNMNFESFVLNDLKSFLYGNRIDIYKLIGYADWIKNSIEFPKNISEDDNISIKAIALKFKKFIDLRYYIKNLDEMSDLFAKFLYYFALEPLLNKRYNIEIEAAKDI